MDTSFIITCLVVTGIIFIPFIFVVFLGKKGSSVLNAKTKEHIKSNNLTISNSENWGLRYIGIDQTQKKMLFIKSGSLGGKQAQEISYIVDLERVKSCSIAEKRKARNNSANETVLDTLDLIILLKDGNSLHLNFYDVNDGLMENWEMKRIEKWQALVVANTTLQGTMKKAA